MKRLSRTMGIILVEIIPRIGRASRCGFVGRCQDALADLDLALTCRGHGATIVDYLGASGEPR